MDNRAATFALNRPILLQYLGGFEPPAIRVRGGLILTAITVILLLPAEGGAVLFTMVIAGGGPVWPTVGEGLFVVTLIAGLFAGAPLLGMYQVYRWPDAARWILLAFIVAGVIGAATTTVFSLVAGSPRDALLSVLALGWLWAVPSAGLLALKRLKFGRPLPSLQVWLHILDRASFDSLPITARLQTGQLDVREVTVSGSNATPSPIVTVVMILVRGVLGRVVGRTAYELWTPEARFWLPPHVGEILVVNAKRGEVEYDLRRGRVLRLESPPGKLIYRA